MRQRLVYILKHYAFVQKTYRIVLNLVFRLWGKFIKTDDTCVLFVSFMGMKFNDSPKAIYDYMKGHPEYQKYNCIWAFEHPEIVAVEAETDPDNVASQKVLNKCGFKPNGKIGEEGPRFTVYNKLG